MSLITHLKTLLYSHLKIILKAYFTVLIITNRLVSEQHQRKVSVGSKAFLVGGVDMSLMVWISEPFVSHVWRRRSCPCQYFAHVFALAVLAVVVSTHLYVFYHHFICLMWLFQCQVVCRSFLYPNKASLLKLCVSLLNLPWEIDRILYTVIEIFLTLESECILRCDHSNESSLIILNFPWYHLFFKIL